jgi:hypothetical protein
VSDHDPIKFVTDLGAKLASTSRHVCTFLGAGVARACGLPDVTELQDRVLKNLEGEQRKAFARQLEGQNLEQALSRLRRLAGLLTGNDTLYELTAEGAATLDRAVCRAIIKELDIQAADLIPIYQFAAWAARANYRTPLELFTINYDLLLETALDRLRVPYFDGFIGTLKARFHTDLVEANAGVDAESVPAFFVRLWKLHGSVHWAWDDDQHIVRMGKPVEGDRVAAIYPSDSKYEESRRVPFVVLQDRFRRALNQPETLTLVSGYSFRDQHLNELLFDAATRRARSEVVIFCHSTIPESLSKRASVTPNLQVVSGGEAILGGIRANWKPPTNSPPNLWENGQLALADFKHLAAYLGRSSTSEPEREALLRDLLAQALTVRSTPKAGDSNA